MLLLMIFLHIVDDFYLQGILSKMKQKQFWEENAPDTLYKYDYIASLIIHSFSWSFMIMLPFAVQMEFELTPLFYMIFITNMYIHGVADDEKANKKTINLCIDQSIHLAQIIFTYLLLKY